MAEAGVRLWAIVKAAACCGSRGGSALGRAISVRNEAVAHAQWALQAVLQPMSPMTAELLLRPQCEQTASIGVMA